MSLRKLIKQVISQEKSQQVQIQIGTSTSQGADNQGVKVKGRTSGYSTVPSLTGDRNGMNDDLVILQVNSSSHLPLIIGKGGYMYPGDLVT